MEIIENSISSTRVLNGTFSFSGGVVIVGALRTTLLLGPLVYGSIIEIRKNRGGSPKRWVFFGPFKIFRHIAHSRWTGKCVHLNITPNTNRTLTEIESQIRKSF